MGFFQNLGLILIFLFVLGKSERSQPNGIVKKLICNRNEYSPGTNFAGSLPNLLIDLETETPTVEDYDYANHYPPSNPAAYGYAKCNQDISAADCGKCLQSAVSILQNRCPMRVGAQLKVADCSLRYEQYPFDT